MNIESIKQFVKDHKKPIIIGGITVGGIVAAIAIAKGHAAVVEEAAKAVELEEKGKDIIGAFTRWEGSVDPDAGSGGLDVIIDKTFPDIQSAGGWLMDNWDKVPGWRDGIIQIVKDCGEHQNEIQIFCQLL